MCRGIHNAVLILLLASCAGQPAHKVAVPLPEIREPIVATGTYAWAISGIAQPDGHVEHVIALKDVSPDQTTAGIDIVSTSESTAPVSLTGDTPSADPYSVVVSPAAPEAVLFRTTAGTGMYADLSHGAPAVQPIDQASNLAPGGLLFGADGRQVLFCANFDSTRGTCDLLWSHGTSASVPVASGCNPMTLLRSRDRTAAIAGVQWSPTAGTGDLIAIDLTTGEATPIDSGVILLASAYASVDYRLRNAPDLAFSAAPDGRAVAYATTDGRVWLWTAASGRTLVGVGRFPGVSPDGSRVAFTSAAGLTVWASGSVLATVSQGSQLSPRFSPDGRFVAFLTTYTQRGLNVFYGTALGDVSILDLSPGGAVAPWGMDVAWHSVVFGPDEEPTTYVTMLADCHDETGTATLDGAIANLLTGDPAGAPPMPVARDIDPFLVPLPLSGGVAYMASDPPFGGSPSFSASAWLPGSAAPQMLSQTAINGTVQSGVQLPPSAMRPSPFSDEILFLGVNQIPSFRTAGFTLYGARPDGAVFELDQNVIDAAIADDGRVIAVESIEGMQPLVRIQVFPFAPRPASR